jgi:hypothetical protein
MLKSLAIIGLAALLLGWPCVSHEQKTPTHSNQQVNGDQNRQIPPAESIPTQVNPKSESQSAAKPNKDESPFQLPPSWKKPEWIIVYVTAAYTVISLLALGVIWLQVRIMKDTAQRQLRAYVLAETGTIVNVANPDKSKGPKSKTGAELSHPQWGPIVKIQIKNTGSTPAHDVVHWAGIYHRELPLKSPLPPMPSEGDFNKSPMGPGIPITKTLFFGPPLSADQIKSLKEGTAAIYCQGIIHYRDTFMKKHFTRYRLMHCVLGGRIGINTDLTFCEEGNDTDDTQIHWWKFWRWKSVEKPKHPDHQAQQRSQKPN